MGRYINNKEKSTKTNNLRIKSGKRGRQTDAQTDKRKNRKIGR